MTKKISTSNQFLIEANSLSIQYNKIKSEIEKIYDPMKIYNSDFPDYIVDGMDKNQVIENFRTNFSKNYGQDKFGRDSPKNEQVRYAIIKDDEMPGCMNATMYHAYERRYIEYYENLPSLISQLKKLDTELNVLINAANKRSPKFFKSGNLKQSIEQMVSRHEVKDLIREAEFILHKAYAHSISNNMPYN